MSGEAPLPNCDYEDEDFGEWDPPRCISCGTVAPASIRESVMDALTQV